MIGTTHRWRELALMLCLALVVTSFASHLMVRWLRIRASWGDYRLYGAPGGKGPIPVHGSSVAFAGIDWREVSEALGSPIERWGVPGSTPSEWEQMQLRSAGASRSVIVVSAADLNEYELSDFRADVVPLTQTIRELWQLGADWAFSKRVLSQYPIRAVRVFFPTVGRSDGVMTGVRDNLMRLAGRAALGDGPEAVGFEPQGAVTQEERVSDWPPGRLQRRVFLMRAGFQNRLGFNGLKKAAMTRILQRAHAQGEVVLVVLPVAPVYQQEFLSPTVKQDFERELLDLQRLWPRSRWIRIDELPALQDNRLFGDLVHLNRDGQVIATRALLNELATESRVP